MYPFSVDDLTAIGSAALVVLATAGSTNSIRTINAHLLTYGEQPSGVVILERRYGPRRLRDDDDDDSQKRILGQKCARFYVICLFNVEKRSILECLCSLLASLVCVIFFPVLKYLTALI